MSEQITPLRGEGRYLAIVGGLWGEMLAEFLGTFVLLAFGDGVVAMTVAGLPGSGRTADPTTFFQGAGDWMPIAWGWAFAVTFGVYVAGGISGAHINPAVTLAFAARRKFPWRKVVPYWVAQVTGAFTGAALVYAVYQSAINAYSSAANQPISSGNAVVTFSIFATFPAPYFPDWVGPFVDQVVGTGLLLLAIAALVDNRNLAVKSNLGGLLIGLVVGAIGLSFGANAGYAINPARDFGPRAFAYLAGWGDIAFPGTVTSGGFNFHNYMWIPIVGPLIGGVVGLLVYDFFIGDVLHARGLPASKEEVPPTRVR